MDDDAPTIYGLEFQARALASVAGDAEQIRFLVGTQTLRNENQIHALLFDDEDDSLRSRQWSHAQGEIWGIYTSPTQTETMAMRIRPQEVNANIVAALYQLPDAEEEEPADPSVLPPIEQFCVLESESSRGDVLGVTWHPTKPDVLATCTASSIDFWEYKAGSCARTGQIIVNDSASAAAAAPLLAMRWSSHHGSSCLAAASGSSIVGWDVRSYEKIFSIDGAHNLVHDVDFNHNKQYHLVSCGDDGVLKFWDYRNPQTPLFKLSAHNHWAWHVRYNQFHDQLLLSSGSDSLVALSNVASLSSDIYGDLSISAPAPHDSGSSGSNSKSDSAREGGGVNAVGDGIATAPHGNEDDADDDAELDSPQKQPLPDEVVATYDLHEDSVYSVEWSCADPWIFASLSYDGRLVINRVPRNIKFNILL
eukprot:m.71069 g.71069  ORF g.71069 m.71069 type:complete len:421 (+) comp7915_c0_seq2:99-1361(+)